LEIEGAFGTSSPTEGSVVARANKILEAYQLLLAHFGPQEWWPGDSPFEVMVGAVLTQNTNWENVEKAIVRLKEQGALSFSSLLAMPAEELAHYIRPSGYYNIKANRLKNLLSMIARQYEGEIEALFAEGLAESREALLSVKGVGPETADSILLYAANQPSFVVDAYTHRVFSRHQLLPEECDYDTVKELFEDNLPTDATLFNEYHALIVAVGKKYCKKKRAECDLCPLHSL
jgi:endonuclease-3 related protein